MSGRAVGASGRETADVGMDILVARAAQVGSALSSRGLTMVTAESCTGGLVGHVLTEVPGSSAWYLGGVVVYSDALKRRLAGVPGEVLATHGAVSAEVAAALASGVRERLGADIGVSVTGIAGPSGATPTKPVGLVHVAVADETSVTTERHVWDGDRGANKRASADAVLRALLARVAAGAS